MTHDGVGRVARGLVDHPYRGVVLAVLDAEESPVRVEALARTVVAYEPHTSALRPADDGVDTDVDVVRRRDVGAVRRRRSSRRWPRSYDTHTCSGWRREW
jgi:hypothetical protein